MERIVVKTDQAPAAIGPYSQGIQTGGWVFTSGQLPINPATGEVNSEDIAEQTHQTLKNIRAVLEAAGSTMERVVKVGVYITDMAEFTAMNAVYAEYFSQESPPARATVEIAGLAKGAKIEIDAIALVDA